MSRPITVREAIDDFTRDLNLAMLGAALHHLHADHEVVIAARVGLGLGDQRRGIADEMKAVSAAVCAEWTDLLLRDIRARPATFVGVPREPALCDACHRRLGGLEAAA